MPKRADAMPWWVKGLAGLVAAVALIFVILHLTGHMAWHGGHGS